MLTPALTHTARRYSAFLQPTQFRAAIRQLLPAERSYLEAQYVGVGLQLGGTSPLGGRVVVAPLAESPAEAAGGQQGTGHCMVAAGLLHEGCFMVCCMMQGEHEPDLGLRL